MKRAAAGEWIFAAGLAFVLALIASVASISLVLRRHVEMESADVDRRAERSAHLIGEMGELITRMWAETLETVTEDDGATVDAIAASVERQRGQLEDAIALLPSVLAPGDEALTSSFQDTRRQIAALRRTVDRALQLRLDGKRDDAEELLDAVVDDHERMERGLERLDDAVHRANSQALARSEEAMLDARVAEAIAFAALFAATFIVGGVLVVVLRRQRRATAAHLAAVESTNRELEAFAGRIAHDLKNILAPIPLALPIIARNESAGPAVKGACTRIERSVRRAVDLLEGLLAFARAGAPKKDDHPRASLQTEMDGVLEELVSACSAADAVVDVEVEPALEVACAPPLLHVVLLNLVGNAVKFLAGRPERRVRVVAHADDVAAGAGGETCRIVVADTGPGIPAGAVDHIFEPFYRAPGATAGGTGIGLATVRRIVEAYGGSIHVDTREGAGASFALTLPLYRAAPTAPAASSTSP